MKLSPEEFVKMWQESENMADFLRKSGMNENPAYVRAARYRKHGVPLKTFPPNKRGGGRVDYEALVQIAKEAEV